MLKYLLLLLLSAFIGMVNPHSALAQEDAALQSANAWLALADAGENRKTWDQASTLFKKNVSLSDWQAALARTRDIFGSAGERTVLSSQSATSLPGAPDGEYVVFRYQTRFSNKNEAIETVTLHKDRDGTWRTTGYFIQ